MSPTETLTRSGVLFDWLGAGRIPCPATNCCWVVGCHRLKSRGEKANPRPVPLATVTNDLPPAKIGCTLPEVSNATSRPSVVVANNRLAYAPPLTFCGPRVRPLKPTPASRTVVRPVGPDVLMIVMGTFNCGPEGDME